MVCILVHVHESETWGGVGVAKMGAAREGGSAVQRHDNDSPVIVCNDQSLSLFFSDNTISGIYLIFKQLLLSLHI